VGEQTVVERDDITQAISEGSCQIGLDVRPDGFTLLAEVQLPGGESLDEVREPLRTSENSFEGIAEEDSSLVEFNAPDNTPLMTGFLRRLGGIFGDLQLGIRAARLAEQRRQECERLRQENHQLRGALEACVDACGRFLGPTLDPVSGDDSGGDHALARVALDGARRVLTSLQPRVNQ
jgi:hypothetical protein